MDKEGKKRNLLLGVVREKCPNCNEGQVFVKRTSLFKIPKMHEDCPNCQYHFEREPGYFLGAMYISYGLAAFQGLLTYVLSSFLFPSMAIGWGIFLIIFSILIFSKKNFKHFLSK